METLPQTQRQQGEDAYHFSLFLLIVLKGIFDWKYNVYLMYSRTQEGSQICPTCYCMTQDGNLFDYIDGLKLASTGTS